MLVIDGVKYKLWTPQDEEKEFNPLHACPSPKPKLSQQIKVCKQTKEVMKENPNGWLEK